MRLTRSRQVWYRTAAAVAAAAVVWLGSESFRIEVRTVDIQLPELSPADDGFRVALVSDQHFGPHDRGRARRIAEKVNSLAPDAILLLGDHVNGSPDPRRSIAMNDLAEFVKALKARCGVYAVTGNHEMWYGRTKVAAALKHGGAAVITGRRCDLPLPSGGRLQLVGLPDRKTERKYPFPEVAPRQPLLIAMHDPNSLLGIPAEYRRGFAVAGHTHGGQIRLAPGAGGMSWRHVFRYLSLKLGLSKREDKEPIVFFDRGPTVYRGRKLYITSGLGTARLKLRIFCRPEITLLKFRSAPGADAVYTQPLEIP